MVRYSAHMKRGVLGITLLLTISLLPAHSATPPKSGSTCTKQGATKTYQGKKYTCIKSGKKLIWDKGVIVTKPIGTPSGSPTPIPSPISTPTPTPSSSPLPSLTNSPSPTPAPTISTSSQNSLISESIEECKIRDARIKKIQPNNVGFPLTEDIIPNRGVLKIAFIPIDFADARGANDPYVTSNATFSKMKDWYHYFSNGKFSIEAQQSHEWFHSSALSSGYPNLRTSTHQLANNLAQEWINLTGNSYDFTNVKAIFFDFPSSVKGFGEGTQGREDQDGKGIALNTRQGQIRVFFNTTGDYWFKDDAGSTAQSKQKYQWSYYIHELLHSSGIANHAPGNGMPIGIGQNQTPTPQGFSGVMATWQLFLLDWLNPDQIICAKKENTKSGIIKLTPVDEERYGTKMGIITLSQTTALVIESRRPIDWSSEMDKNTTGIIVYVVNTTLDSDRSHESLGDDNGNQPEFTKWAYLRLPDEVLGGYSVRRNFTDFFLKPGQSVTFEEIKITLMSSAADDLVSIEKKN